jgi:hypothetical protein
MFLREANSKFKGALMVSSNCRLPASGRDVMTILASQREACALQNMYNDTNCPKDLVKTYRVNVTTLKSEAIV